jgi:hypothetical protein
MKRYSCRTGRPLSRAAKGRDSAPPAAGGRDGNEGVVQHVDVKSSGFRLGLHGSGGLVLKKFAEHSDDSID